MTEKNRPAGKTRPTAWGVVGGCIGGAAGFLVRGYLNEKEVIGFANIPGQLVKLALWACVGAGAFTVLGFFIGREVARIRRYDETVRPEE